MVEVTQTARDASARLMPVNTMAECERVADTRAGRNDGHHLVQAMAEAESRGVQQGLDMAAEGGRAGIYQLTDEGFVVGCCEFRESHADDMAGAVAAAIRKLGGGDA